MFATLLALTISGTLITSDPIIIKAPNEDVTILPDTHLESEQMVIIDCKTFKASGFYIGSDAVIAFRNLELDGETKSTDLTLYTKGPSEHEIENWKDFDSFEEFSEWQLRGIRNFYWASKSWAEKICRCFSPEDFTDGFPNYQPPSIESFEGHQKKSELFQSLYDPLPYDYISENVKDLITNEEESLPRASSLAGGSLAGGSLAGNKLSDDFNELVMWQTIFNGNLANPF